MERFAGKVAVVTGASAGIGAAIAEELVKNGVIVAGLARRVEKVEELAKKINEKKGCFTRKDKSKGKLYAFKCDMTKEADIVSAFKNIVSKLGSISILINSAGMMKITDLINGDTAKWKSTFDTNVLGLSIATREGVQNMKNNRTEGHIIHINSLAGHIVADFPGINVYGASKYAVTALAETLRLDLNREKLPIKVTNISPGYVKTEFQTAAGFEGGVLPLPPLYALDIAEAVIYALSTPPHVNIKELTLQAVGS